MFCPANALSAHGDGLVVRRYDHVSAGRDRRLRERPRMDSRSAPAGDFGVTRTVLGIPMLGTSAEMPHRVAC